MVDNSEVIALLLPLDAKDNAGELRDFVATGTMLLIRHPDGRTSLESTRPEKSSTKLDRGSYVDREQLPQRSVSPEILGHELEIVASTPLC